MLFDDPAVGWTVDAVRPELLDTALPTTSSVAISGDRIAAARDLGPTFAQHVVLIYERQPDSGGWSPVDLLELPGESAPGLDRRNISDVVLSGSRVWVSQGSRASVTAYELSNLGLGHEQIGIVRGMGGSLATSDHWVAGSTLLGSAYFAADSFQSCAILSAR